MKRFILLLVIAFPAGFIQLANSQAPFSRGVNITNWFQTSNSHQIQLSKYSKKDFENIKSLGCDVIRLPINLFYMTNGKPDYTIDPLLFQFLDQAVTWAEDLNIYLLLDNHSTDDIASKNPDLETVLSKVWIQMAEHYKDRSTYILYEIMNEPNGLTTQAWGNIQQTAIDAIRSIDTTHTLVVGPSSYNSYNDLNLLPVYTDNKLIYTFHFYDPFIFTHQGANWPNPSLAPLTKIPFPFNADSMPQLPDVLKGTWIASAYNNYYNDGTVAKVKELIDKAVAFQTSRNVNLYCGEFGVYIPYSRDTDRVYWYSEVQKYLEEKGIAWTSWDYKGGFGLFNKGTNEMFDYNINVPLVKALGLNEPVQYIFEMKPDSVGFNIYSDFIGEQTVESSNTNGGTVDFYSVDKPDNGLYCIFWTGSSQYGSVGFDFTLNKDMSELADSGYAVSFLVRGNTPGAKFDIRFIDTKTSDPNDHPWRMNYTLDENSANWDGKWHKVYIPLKNFIDQGSWDNAWYGPIGAFDWQAVDRFDIVAEHSDLKGKAFWFDNISVTNMDTIQINDTSTFELPANLSKINSGNYTSCNVYPNPVNNSATICYTLIDKENVDISIFNLSGQKVKSIINTNQQPGDYLVTWNTDNDNGNKVSRGVYICRILISDKVITSKITVIRN
jgi:endoglucanase